MTHYLVPKVGCENCTQTTLYPDCQRNAAEYQAWADAQSRLQAWLNDEANQRYSEAQWAREGAGFSEWFRGYGVGR